MLIKSAIPGRIRFHHPRLVDLKQARWLGSYLETLYGVEWSRVNPRTGSMLVVFDRRKTDSALLAGQIDRALASPPDGAGLPPNRIGRLIEQRDRAGRHLFLLTAAYLLLLAKKAGFGRSPLSQSIPALQAASLVTVIGGYPLLKKIYRQLAGRILGNPDQMLTMTGLVLTLARESGKGVLVLLLKELNSYLEQNAELQYRRLLPSDGEGMAWLAVSGGPERLVPAASLRKGDRIIVHRGEVLPADGKVAAGKGMINHLYYSGQPVISRVGGGDRLQEGMTLVEGRLRVAVTGTSGGSPGTAARHQTMPLGERITGYQRLITPAALTAATLSLAGSGSLLRALAVLLILAPSAAATALSSGLANYLSLLAQHRIHLRHPHALEAITAVKTAVLDKSGTLTDGRMEIVSARSFDDNYTPEELLVIAAACEARHYHPIALTLNLSRPTRPIDRADHSRLLPSRGVEAVHRGRRVLIGGQELLEERGIDLSPVTEAYRSAEEQLLTPLLIGIDGRLTGLITLRENLRERSSLLVKKLKEIGVNPVLLTGDSEEKARRMAGQLGIGDWHSECQPGDKADLIRQYQRRGKVLMLGDGINDREAMRQADVSATLAHSSHHQVRLDSDCLLDEDQLDNLAELITLSQQSYRRINQAITWSQIYNIYFGIGALGGRYDAFTAKSLNTVNSLLVLLLNQRIRCRSNSPRR